MMHTELLKELVRTAREKLLGEAQSGAACTVAQIGQLELQSALGDVANALRKGDIGAYHHALFNLGVMALSLIDFEDEDPVT